MTDQIKQYKEKLKAKNARELIRAKYKRKLDKMMLSNTQKISFRVNTPTYNSIVKESERLNTTPSELLRKITENYLKWRESK